MKKISFLCFLILSLLLSGCSNTNIKGSLVDVFKETFYNYGTKQESKYGFEGIYANELLERINEEDCFVYLYDSSMPNNLIEEVLDWGFAKENIDVLAKGYIIDYSILEEEEKINIREVFKDNTLYAIENGKVKSIFKDYPLIPKENSLNYDLEYKKAIESWFYSTMVGVNNHEFETITYEEILTKIENKEVFMLYVGRNSCKYCQIFTPVLSNFVEQYDFYVGDENKVKVPLYYLDTQIYYNDIVYAKENADENWTSIKETFGLEFVPGFLLFKDELVYKNPNDIFSRTTTYGSQQFVKYIGSEYFTSNEEERISLYNECFDNLKDDLDFVGDIIEKENISTTNYLDNRTFFFDNEESYEEDCFTYEEQWVRYIKNKEYLDVVNDTYLENFQNNILKYSVSLSEILGDDELSYTIGDHGTGFIIDVTEDCLYIATNKHVVEDEDALGFETKFCFLWEQSEIPRYNNNLLGQYKYFWKPLKGTSHIVGYSDTYDFAILRFDFEENKFNGEERYLFHSIPRFDTAIPNVGDKLYRWNTISLRKGTVDYSFDEFSITKLDCTINLGDHFIELDKIGVGGTSGSPFFNKNGELIGINVGSSPYNSYILPASIVLEEYEKIIGQPLFEK